MSTFINIKPINTDKWVRPAGWLAMPNIQPTDNHIAILYAIFEDEINVASVSAAVTSSGAIYNINWGDGTNENANNSLTRSKTYDYSTITSPILQDKNGRNYKQVLIEITPVSGTAINGWNLSPGVSNRPKNNTLEIVYAWNLFGGSLTNPGEFSGISRRALICESIKIVSGSISSSGIGTGRLSLLNNLKNFEIGGLSFIDVNVSQLFSQLGAWNGGDLTIGGTAGLRSIVNCFLNSSFKKIGNINTPLVTSHQAVFQANFILEEVGNIDASSSTTLAAIFNICYNLRKVGTIQVSSALTTISSAFANCQSVNEIVFVGDMGNCGTPAGSPFLNNTSLKVLRLPNIKHSLLLTNTSLQRPAIIDLFNDLGTVTPGSATITLSGSVGALDLTAADLLIAQNKGWLVVQ